MRMKSLRDEEENDEDDDDVDDDESEFGLDLIDASGDMYSLIDLQRPLTASNGHFELSNSQSTDGSIEMNGSSSTADDAAVPMSVDGQTSALHSSAWRKCDLDTLYETIRPTPLWTKTRATPDGLVTPLMPYQQQALAWLLSREEGNTDEIWRTARQDDDDANDMRNRDENIDSVFEHVYIAGRHCWYHRVYGSLRTVPPPPTPPVYGGILAEQMGLGKTMECIALVLANPFTGETILPPAPTQSTPPDDFKILKSVKFTFNGAHIKREAVTIAPSDPASFIHAPPRLIDDDMPLPLIKATLIVTPMSIVYQWANELNKHAPSALKVYVFTEASIDALSKHSERVSLSALASYDVVITSYSILSQHIHYNLKSKTLRHRKKYAVPQSPFLCVHWHRVILDEAQRVHRTVVASARMVRRLSTTYRWCVSGTPIGPRGLNDLNGLIIFLGVGEYEEPSTWMHTMKVETAEGMFRLSKLLKTYMWRHNKAHVIDQIQLPPLHTQTVHLNFSVVESVFYKRLELDVQGKVFFAEIRGQLDTGRDYTGRIDALRQACCCPSIATSHSLLNAMSADPTLAAGVTTAASGGNIHSLKTLPEIRSMMCARAADEATKIERDLCRTMNTMAVAEFRQGNVAKAEERFMSAWKVIDSGVFSLQSNEDDVDKQKRMNAIAERHNNNSKAVNSSAFDSNINIVTANAQVRPWRFIELITTYYLKKIYQSKLQTFNVNDSNYSTTYAQLTAAEHRVDTCIADLLEPYEFRCNEYAQLAQRFEAELIPANAAGACDEVQTLLQHGKEHITRDAFHRSQYFTDSFALLKSIKHRKERLSNILEVTDACHYLPLITDLLNLLKDNYNHICDIKERVHQELMKTFYATNGIRTILMTSLSKAAISCIKTRDKKIKILMDTSVDEDEKERIRLLNFDDEIVRFRLESEWKKMYYSENTIMCLHDERLTHLKMSKLREDMAIQRQALLDMCERTNGEKVIESLEAMRELSLTEQEEKRRQEMSDQDSDEAEPAAPTPAPTALDESEFIAHMAALKARESSLRIQAVQRQNHLKFCRRRFYSLADEYENANTFAGHTCPICHSQVTAGAVVTVCGHIFCQPCLANWITTGNRRKHWERPCPTCRHTLTEEDVAEMPHERFALNEDDTNSPPPQSSSTVTAHKPVHTVSNVSTPIDNHLSASTPASRATLTLSSTPSISSSSFIQSLASSLPPLPGSDIIFPPLSEIQQVTIKDAGLYGTKVDTIVRYLVWLQQHHPRVKSLVYSAFPRMLDLFKKILNTNGVDVVQLKGNMQKSATQIQSFHSQPNHNVLLLSLRKDNSGLTLVSAQCVFIVEPSLNASVHAQAINRVHRIGQTKPSYVFTFVMRRSVEETIMADMIRQQANVDSKSVADSRTKEDRALSQVSREKMNVQSLLHVLGIERGEDDRQTNVGGERPWYCR